jgi:hypothetical protein
MPWDGMPWDGMPWDGMLWDGMLWDARCRSVARCLRDRAARVCPRKRPGVRGVAPTHRIAGHGIEAIGPFDDRRTLLS